MKRAPARPWFAWAGGALCGGAAALAIAACSASTGAGPDLPNGPDGGSSSGAIPCAVDTLLAANCRSCHAAEPKFGAPMPLVTLADFYAASPTDASRKVYETIPDYLASATKPMPPSPNAPLSASDRATLEAWLSGGPKASTDTCTTAPTPMPIDLSCKTDLDLAPATPYVMPASTGDEYVCYGVDVTRDTPTHVVAFAPRIQNTKIVHHVVLYEADASYSTTPKSCSASGAFQWRMVMGWAPGGKGLEMPPEAGFPIKTGADATHYVVQVHYSNPLALQGETDTSGFSLCTGAPRPNEADVAAFGTQKIQIPPGGYSRTCSSTVSAQLAGAHLVASMPHMHKLGTEMTTTITPSGADLGTVKNWSFDTQAWLPIDKSVVTHEGDVITTKCSWANPTNSVVSFGENTENEMCYSFTVYYPKVTGNLWSWALPAATSKCQP